MVLSVEEQTKHRSECWFCTCFAYARVIMNVYASYLHLSAAALKFCAAASKAIDEGKEPWEHFERFRNEQLAHADHMEALYSSFRSAPEHFFAVSESQQLELRKTNEARRKEAETAQQRPSVIPTARAHPTVQVHSTPKAFRELLYSLLDGLTFVVDHRRPLDVRVSPVHYDSLRTAMQATSNLDDSLIDTHHRWQEAMNTLVAEFKRMSRLKKEHKNMRPGDLISFDLKQRLLNYVHESAPKWYGALEELEAEIRDETASETQRKETSGAAGFRPVTVPKFSHSEHFDSVNWYGIPYSFNAKQAAVVKTLWEAWEAGRPSVLDVDLIAAAGSDGSRVRDIFKSGRILHPAWGTMIVKDGQTHRKLSPPETGEPR